MLQQANKKAGAHSTGFFVAQANRQRDVLVLAVTA